MLVGWSVGERDGDDEVGNNEGIVTIVRGEFDGVYDGVDVLFCIMLLSSGVDCCDCVDTHVQFEVLMDVFNNKYVTPDTKYNNSNRHIIDNILKRLVFFGLSGIFIFMASIFILLLFDDTDLC